jgi:16S rRNA (guanine966-N2)-methyltransferase
MRIIAGRWRSRPLVAPAGATTRPTLDRVRETLFSMLTSRIGSWEELTVLDLFAGSGALSLEALSRGAAQAWLVEADRAARAAIVANIAALGASARLIGHDCRALPRAGQPADVVFLDPPYGQGLAAPALAAARTQGWIAPATWIAVETARSERLDAEGFATEAVRPVGKAAIHLLQAG